MSAIIGYIVEDRRGMELGSYDDSPRAGILLYGDSVTLFKTRARARGALKRTKEYEQAHDLKWDTWKMRIVAVREQEGT